MNLKYHRSCPAAQEIWVFGIVVASSWSDGNCPRPISADAAANYAVAPPEWKHCSQRLMDSVQQLAPVVQHDMVNHSLNFVDPVTGVHTQNVESYWNRVKTKFKKMKGVHQEMLTSHMDEFMWRERHGTVASIILANLCQDIALRYPQ